jgi:hypothetical protein
MWYFIIVGEINKMNFIVTDKKSICRLTAFISSVKCYGNYTNQPHRVQIFLF